MRDCATATLATLIFGGISVMTTAAIGSVVAPPLLERAARVQCLNHNWPESQHEAHMRFCKDNGYATLADR